MLKTRHIISTSAATLFNALLGFSLTFLVARLLSPTENGYYAQFLFLMNFFYIAFNFGVGTSSTYFLASKKINNEKIQIINIAFFSLLGIITLASILILTKTSIINKISETIKMPETLFYTGLIAGLLLTGFYQITSIMMGLHQYDKSNLAGILRNSFPLAFIFIFLFFLEKNSLSISYIYISSLFLSTLLGILIMRCKDTINSKKNSLKIRDFLQYGSITYFSNLLHFLAVRGILIAISYYSLPEEVGYFNLALLLIEGMLLLPSIIGQLLFPQASTDSFSHKTAEKILRINLLISILIISIIYATSQHIITVFLGVKYTTVAILLVHLLPSIVLMVIPRIMSQILSGLGHPTYPLTAAILSLIVGVPLTLYLLPLYGIIGAAWVTNTTTLITMLVTMYGYSYTQQRNVLQILTPQIDDMISIARILSYKKST